MKRSLQIAMFALAAVTMAPHNAAADYWARLDRPWTAAELDRAVNFCRMQPGLGPNIKLFVDQLMGQQIQTCMRALGWVAVAW